MKDKQKRVHVERRDGLHSRTYEKVASVRRAKGLLIIENPAGRHELTLSDVCEVVISLEAE